MDGKHERDAYGLNVLSFSLSALTAGFGFLNQKTSHPLKPLNYFLQVEFFSSILIIQLCANIKYPLKRDLSFKHLMHYFTFITKESILFLTTF